MAAKQSGPLGQPGGQRRPFAGGASTAAGRRAPSGGRGPARIAVDVVGDAVFVNEPPGLLPAAFELVGAQRVEQFDELTSNVARKLPSAANISS